MSMITTKVWVVGATSMGDPGIFETTVTLTQSGYDNGNHYDIAENQAEEDGYEAPFVCFDESDNAMAGNPFGTPVKNRVCIIINDGGSTVDVMADRPEELAFGLINMDTPEDACCVETYETLSGDEIEGAPVILPVTKPFIDLDDIFPPSEESQSYKPESTQKAFVLIEVSRGVAECTRTGGNVEVAIYDHDDEETDVKSLHPLFQSWLNKELEPSKVKPVVRFTINAKGDEVTDTQTGLIWRRFFEGKVLEGRIPQGETTRLTWDKAMAYAAAQSGGWRLPTVEEFRAIFAESKPGKGLFPGGGWVWSASPDAFYPGLAWAVNFNDGDDSLSYKNDNYPARLVRSQ